MPINIFGGGAEAIAQVVTVTVDAPPNPGDVYTLTVTLDDGQTREVEYTATTGDTEADVLGGLEALWNANRDPAFLDITAEADSSVQLTLTSEVAGVPFHVSASANTGAAITAIVTIANSGPNDYGTPENWSLGRIPIASDDVQIAPGASAILYGLDQSEVVLTSFKRLAGHTAQIGREGPAPLGEHGAAPRCYLRIRCTGVVEIRGGGTFVAIDLGISPVSPLIEHLGLPASNRDAAVYLKGSALNTPEIRAGYVRLETLTLTGDLYVSGNSHVILSDDCDCEPVGGSTLAIVGPNANVVAYCNVDDVDIRKGATYHQSKGVWNGLLTMHDNCVVIADSADTYGDVLAWGGTLVTDQTPGAKIINSIVINSAEFSLHQLAGKVTVSSMTVNVSGSDGSTVVYAVAR